MPTFINAGTKMALDWIECNDTAQHMEEAIEEDTVVPVFGSSRVSV